MKNPVVIIGIGEMAGVFARGLLRTGYPVYPITRDMNMEQEAKNIPEPEAVFVTVAEKDLQPTLAAIPSPWRNRLVLIQNELLPRDWLAQQLKNPTVISVWFEKKPGQDYKILIPSPVFGAHASLVNNALEAINIPCRVVGSEEELLFELVCKNLYILTTNITGLETGGSVSELWHQHEKLARLVAGDVMDLQEWLTGTTFDRENLIQAMLVAFRGDPDHQCMGRSAPARLERALTIADEAGLTVPKLREIHSQA
ncbi:MAG: hypothetical protein OEY67_04550 [Gammaproteobacteria bacterium]|nr:hypothetical protein [Gammaproteobacteria bacterium]